MSAAGLRTSLRARVLVLAALAAAVTACWAAHSWLGDALVLVIMPVAVATAVWLGGVPAALMTAVVGYLACDLLFIGGAPGEIGPRDVRTAVELAAYVIASAIVIGFGEALWRVRAREQHARGIELAERREAEETRASLAAIIETSDDAVVSKSLDGIIRSWNPAAERLFGYTAEEAVGRSIELVIPPELRDEEVSILQRLRQGQRIDHFETVRMTRDGRRLDISLSISPIRNESGTIVGASKIARDITEHRRAEAALRFSEERFRELANNIDQFAWSCDEQGNATWYNQRWYDYTGSTIEQMRGDGWAAFQHPDHVDRVVNGMRSCMAAGEAWEDTFPLRSRQGEYRWFLSRAVPIHDAQGRVVRWFGTNTDVTEQLKLEQELKTADRRKDEFLATLAHELRNPLAPIRNALELLKLSGDDPQRLDQAWSIIDRQVTHMVRLVEDLLDVSRITRDRLELRIAPVELNALVEQTLATHRSQVEEQGLTLELALAPQPVHLQADPVRLAQIVSNLMNNAVRYTRRGGSISVSVEREGHDVLLRVRDTGIGIPPDKLNDIFDMFAQIGDPQSAHGGLGIGLTLVRRLAELHGGRVEATSEGLGKGSEFRLRLPLARASGSDSGPPSDAPRIAAASRRVLVVEDNPDTAATLSTLLELAGHQTRVAYDGVAAIDQVEEFRPDVVLLDLGLPKKDGIEVCRWIRRQPWGKRIMVAALTGWGQESDRRKTQDAGFDTHLVKPVGPEAVLELLANGQA